MKSFSRIRRRNMPMPSNQSHTAATDKSSTSTFLLLLTTVQFMLATATTVPPLTARAGRTYRQKYGETSLEGTWYLDCGPLGKETKALLFITIDTPLFSTYGVDLSIDWGDFTTPIEKRYGFLSTGIRHSVPLAHTYYYTGEFDVTLTAIISRSTNDNAALSSRSTGDWPMGRTIRTDNWTIFVDRTQCTNDYDPEALDTSDGKKRHHLGGAAFVVTMASSLLLYVWL